MKNLRQYEIVVEIATQKSISKAAERLHISQSTLSKLLCKLEQELHTELFDRSVIPIRLTRAGEIYFESAQKILSIDRQLEKNLEQMQANISDDIRFGISPSRAPFILPQLLSSYREKCRDGKIIIQEGSIAQLNSALSRSEVDIIISLLNDNTIGFKCIPLWTETTLLAIHKTMESLSSEEILRSQPIITMRKGLRFQKITSMVLEKVNREEPAIECQSIETALSLVNVGLGAMLVPSYLSYDKSVVGESVRFLELPKFYYDDFSNEMERKICLFFRDEAFLSASEKKFIEACREIKCDYVFN